MNKGYYPATILTLTMATVLVPHVQAQGFNLANANTSAVDKSNWRCELCAGGQRPAASTGSMGLQLVHQTKHPAPFTRITGLTHQGSDVGVSGEYQDSGEWSASARNLGLSSHAFALTYDTSQSSQIALSHRRQAFMGRTLLSPFSLAGQTGLTLPNDWQYAPLTSAFNVSQFSPYQQQLTHNLWQLSVSHHWSKNWQNQLSLNYRDTEGLRGANAALYTQSVSLLIPIDERQFDISLGNFVSFKRGNLLLHYTHSEFDNALTGWGWEHPFTPVGGDDATPQLATAPDNRLHRLLVNSHYSIGQLRLSLKGRFAWMSSDINHSDYPGLIGSNGTYSQHARVKGRYLSLRGDYPIMPRWRLTAALGQRHRDSQYPNLRVLPLPADGGFSGSLQQPSPQDLSTTSLRLKNKWRLSGSTRLEIGGLWQTTERSNQWLIVNDSRKYWFDLQSAMAPFSYLGLRAYHLKQDPPDTLGETLPIHWQQWYRVMAHQKESIRARAGFALPWRSTGQLQVGLDNSEYANQGPGRDSAQSHHLDLSTSTIVSKGMSLNLFASRHWRQYKSIHAIAFNGFTTYNEDISDTLGMALTAAGLMDERLELSLSLSLTKAKGEVGQSVLYPEVRSENTLAKLKASYQLTPKLSLTAKLLYQDLSEQDRRRHRPLGLFYQSLNGGLKDLDYDARAVFIALRYGF